MSDATLLRFSWEQTRLASSLRRAGDAAFTIGSGAGVDFACSDVQRGLSKFELVPRGDDGTVRFGERAEGTLWRGEREMSLADAIASGEAEPDGDGYAVTFSRGDALRFSVRGITVEALRLRAPPRVEPIKLEQLDLRALNVFAAVFVVASFAVVSLATAASRDDADPFDSGAQLSRMTRLLIKAPPPTVHPMAMRSATPEKKRAEASPPPSPRSRTPSAGDHGPADVRRGLLTALTQGMGNLLSPKLFEGGLLGNIAASPVANVGLGGSGLRGGNTGGAGGVSIGLGGVVTHGRGGGGDSDYGSRFSDLCGPAERARPGGCKLTTQLDIPGTPVVTGCDSGASGCLDKELIRRVVRQHLSQVRYCYERQLTVSPSLHGKVVVKFGINPGGEVPTAQMVAGLSTMTDAAFVSCLTERVKTWRFPASSTPVVVSYPFIFQRSGS